MSCYVELRCCPGADVQVLVSVALQGQTPLALAVQHDSLDLAEVLLAAGALPLGTVPQVSSNRHTCSNLKNSKLLHVVCAVRELSPSSPRVKPCQAPPGCVAMLLTPASWEASLLHEL